MVTYQEIFAKCKDYEELIDTYEELLDACNDLSEIKNIDNAYLKEYNRRKANDRK